MQKTEKKKATPKASPDAERDWAKYKKQRESEKQRAKKPTPTTVKAVTTTTTAKKRKRAATSGMTGVNVDPEGFLFLREAGLSKTSEPSDRLRLESPSADLEQLRGPARLPHSPVELREKQTMRTLTLSEAHAHFNDLPTELKRIAFERNPEARVYPLQRLLENGGFMPINATNREETIGSLCRDMQLEADYIGYTRDAERKEKEKEGAATPDKQQQQQQPKRDASIAKMNVVFGGEHQSLNYNRRIPKELEEPMRLTARSDRERRFMEFYAQDRIDTECVEFGAIPTNSLMFTQLQAQYAAKYRLHEAVIHDTAAETPKLGIELIPRKYFRQFRMKPAPGSPEQLCARGDMCIFNTFSPLPQFSYIGLAFFTPREKKQGLHLLAVEQRTPRLCIDCTLADLTLQHDRNVADEVEVRRAINRFQVYCKPGEYSPHCMLSVRENDKQTGIEGHVPRFSLNNRDFVIVTERFDAPTQQRLHTVYTPFLAEIGMDFREASTEHQGVGGIRV